MTVRLLYFAGIREALGRSEEDLTLPPGVSTLGALRDHLCSLNATWSALVAGRRLRFAINRAMVSSADAPVRDGDEVAIFPPVTGG